MGGARRQRGLLRPWNGGVGRTAERDRPVRPGYPVDPLQARIDLSGGPRLNALCATGAFMRKTAGGISSSGRRPATGRISVRASATSAHGIPAAISRRCPGTARRTVAALRSAGSEDHLGRSRRSALRRSAARGRGRAAGARRPLHAEPPGRPRDLPGRERRPIRSTLRELSPDTPLIVLKCGAEGASLTRDEADFLILPAGRWTPSTRQARATPSAAARWLDMPARATRPGPAARRGLRVLLRRGGRAAGSGRAEPGEAERDGRRWRIRADTSRFDDDRTEREAVQNEKAVMLQEIAMQPDFVRDNVAPMLAFMREVLRNREPGTLRHGFAIGCGDSYCAALAARSFMMDATGRWSSLSRRSSSRAISSPTSRRTLSFSACPIRERSRGPSKACAWRASAAPGPSPSRSAPSTRLATAAETLIKVNATPNIKERPDGTRVVTPGTVTYTASLLGLCVAGIALGERVGKLDAAPRRSAAWPNSTSWATPWRGGRDRRADRGGDRRDVHARPEDRDSRRRPQLRHSLFRHGEVA